jgi:hypothetical protein
VCLLSGIVDRQEPARKPGTGTESALRFQQLIAVAILTLCPGSMLRSGYGILP